ncbi:hypothetical protein B0J14DRAFT_560904 [Halenospora varia]|nr:hypothetical protein B0J14DRAFT_560904 [Halenospora varia]
MDHWRFSAPVTASRSWRTCRASLCQETPSCSRESRSKWKRQAELPDGARRGSWDSIWQVLLAEQSGSECTAQPAAVMPGCRRHCGSGHWPSPGVSKGPGHRDCAVGVRRQWQRRALLASLGTRVLDLLGVLRSSTAHSQVLPVAASRTRPMRKKCGRVSLAPSSLLPLVALVSSRRSSRRALTSVTTPDTSPSRASPTHRPPSNLLSSNQYPHIERPPPSLSTPQHENVIKLPDLNSKLSNGPGFSTVESNKLLNMPSLLSVNADADCRPRHLN